MKLLQALSAVADEQGVPMATAAVAWLLTRPNVVAPIVSATSVEQVAELVAAPQIALTREQVRTLDAASA